MVNKIDPRIGNSYVIGVVLLGDFGPLRYPVIYYLGPIY